MRLAVLVPCFNEEAAIAQVVADFHAALPGAMVYVYDNNSTDRTRAVAAAAGAVVRGEAMRGKGNVVRRMFADVDADIYVLTDGDATYDASAAPTMIDRLLDDHLDMVVGAREAVDARAAYRAGHRWGNRMLTGTVAWLFGDRFEDMLSGYRVFSRRFVRSFPALATGFETETELTVHALTLRMPIAEVRTRYFERPAGSESKLNTWRDGTRILIAIATLLRQERPVFFFGCLAVAFLSAAIGFSGPIVHDYLRTGLVPRLPTWVLSATLAMVGFVSFGVGLILEAVTLARREGKRLAYLRHEAPSRDRLSAGVSKTSA